MGVSSIAPALPKMARVLEVSNEQIGLLITFFAVPGIFLTPLLGVLADRYGRKTILVPSLFLFGIAGTACAFAADFEWLLALRFLQGVGGASLGALNITLIGDLYEGNRRATAMGYNGSVLSIGTAGYPSIGGGLALLGWFFPFYLSLLAIPVGIAVMHVLKNPDPSRETGLRRYFQNIRDSLLSKQVIGLFLANFLTFIMLYGAYLTYFPILLDERIGLNSFVIGLYISGASVMTGLSSSQLGRLAARFSEKWLIRTAGLMYIVVFGMIPFIETAWMFLFPIMIYGLAQGINIPGVLNLLTYQAPSDYRAAFLSVNWTLIRSGQALGPFLLGLVYGFGGLNGTFYTAVGAAVLFVGIAFVMIRE